VKWSALLSVSLLGEVAGDLRGLVGPEHVEGGWLGGAGPSVGRIPFDRKIPISTQHHIIINRSALL
jgi:hypothetical protein